MTNEEIQVIEHHLRAGSKLLAAAAYSEFTGVDLDECPLFSPTPLRGRTNWTTTQLRASNNPRGGFETCSAAVEVAKL